MLTPSQLTLRFAGPADAHALHDLEGLDGRRLPAGDRLMAEAGGRVVAALEPRSLAAVADPFLRSDEAISLLRLRARQLDRAETTPRRRRLSALRRAPGPAR